MPHLLVFNRSYYPDLGATGQLLTELCEDLVAHHGWEVTVVAGLPTVTESGVNRSGNGTAGSAGWGLVRQEAVRGVVVLRAVGTRLAKARFVGRAANYVSYFTSAALAGRWARRPDLVMSLTDPPILGLAALAWARRWRVPFVFLCQDIFPEVARLLDDFHSPAIERVLEGVNRLLVRRASQVIALGETMRERLVRLRGADPAKVAVIHNWADCARIVPGPKRNPFSLSHGLADRFVVMHSGNIGLSQGLEHVVEAAARLQALRDMQMVFVGDGVKRPALEAQVQTLGLQNVRFLPYQPREQLTESFAAADCFVISLKRGLAGYIVPSKLYGILAAGRPYVAAVEEGCEVSAITRKYDCGLLAEPEDPDDLAKKLLTLYHDRPMLRRLGANARQAALEFDRPLQVRAYYDLFQELTVPAIPLVPHPPLMKRPFDVGLSALGLLLSAPLWFLAALAIKLDDGGPVFYGQERVGKGGQRFWSWKFRSMVSDSDKRFGPLQASDGDSRVTRVGRFLRATALDELPQLWNIFRGDMSFVGPRALVPEEIEVRVSRLELQSATCNVQGSKFKVQGARKGEAVALEKIPGYEERHRVRPGLTGVAQVYAPRDIPRRHKFRLDLLYVKKHTFWLDLKLIALSFWITFRGKWEDRGRKF